MVLYQKWILVCSIDQRKLIEITSLSQEIKNLEMSLTIDIRFSKCGKKMKFSNIVVLTLCV